MKLAKPRKPAQALGSPLKKTKLQLFLLHLRRDWQLHLLILLPVIYMLIFHYWPMYGAQIAFRDFKIKDGITGSKWVWFKWFLKFFKNYNFKQIVGNTVVLSLYNIAVSFPLPVIFALMINTLRSERFKKVTQYIAYMPHFISTVVIVSILSVVFSPINGIWGNLFRFLGGEGYPVDLRGQANTFRHMYVWSGVWQSLGWNTIIYTAALAGVSPELHEAAQVDGATRFQRVLNVDLPSILPTVAIMLIMRFGSIMSIGYEKVFLMQTDLNKTTSQVISTFVYEQGLVKGNNFSYASAIGLFNSVVNCGMLMLVNWITKKISNREVSLF